VQGERRLLDLAHQREVLVAIAIVGRGEEPPVRVEEFHLPRAMRGLARRLPRRRIGTAETVHGLDRVGERDVAAHDLQGEDRDVHVEEEDEAQALDGELDGRRILAQPQVHGGDVLALEHVQAGRRLRFRLADAVEEALHVRQEVDELAVAELARLVVHQQVVAHALPWTRLRGERIQCVFCWHAGPRRRSCSGHSSMCRNSRTIFSSGAACMAPLYPENGARYSFRPEIVPG
jgi:hypothetical protein